MRTEFGVDLVVDCGEYVRSRPSMQATARSSGARLARMAKSSISRRVMLGELLRQLMGRRVIELAEGPTRGDPRCFACVRRTGGALDLLRSVVED
ncbi:MAG: hypothetical protein ACRDQD_18530 [Nocardioidaceae bacterium]